MNNVALYYKSLGLKPDASQAEVKEAYLNLAKTWHPDLFPDAPQLKQKAEEKFKEISEADQQLKFYQPRSPTENSHIRIYPTNSSNAATSNSSDPETYYNQGMENAKKGRYQEEIHKFTIAISLNPNYFSPDGQNLASGSGDNTIKLWQMNTGKQLCTLGGHSDWVNSVVFSPDGKTLVTASRDMTIKIWRCD